MGKLVGYKRFLSKKNKNYCVANILMPYGPREDGCVGEKLEEIFMPDEMYDFLNPKHIGHEVKLDYEINGGRAYLVGFEVL